ncbi:signal peptidase I [Fredinandcohnia quinoae]|uniref:Signal peptidase I n=1 Tax=Fredinandcohnia quinoae TaxID=2918902 RepID=A0AAW5E6I5_9BACI|nr:signal peptidase I [Fredinandcohnia sp. SECRCQ15]MCH1627973.1 signal peptidase I [Fredinandcohnia sp. SECRCQ15]
MKTNKLLSQIWGWGKAFIVALLLSIIISVFIIQPYKVVGSSMEPTFSGEDLYNQDKKGDRVMVFKSAYLFGKEPSYGDLVIIDSQVSTPRTFKDHLLESPIFGLFTGEEFNEKFWIKRVIGVEGDKIEYKDGKVYRNGTLLEESYTKEDILTPFDSVVIPEDHVFVMGDNRNHSSDSRQIGPVPMEHVVGKVVIRFYPFDRIDKY